MEFVIFAKGHPLIKATHRTTFEITKENYLTPRGDCIIGINATHSVLDLPDDIKNYLKSREKVEIILETENASDYVVAFGSPKLVLTNPISIVVRKSNYIDDRTLAIQANKAAKDLDRKLVKDLQEGKELRFIIVY